LVALKFLPDKVAQDPLRWNAFAERRVPPPL